MGRSAAVCQHTVAFENVTYLIAQRSATFAECITGWAICPSGAIRNSRARQVANPSLFRNLLGAPILDLRLYVVGGCPGNKRVRNIDKEGTT